MTALLALAVLAVDGVGASAAVDVTSDTSCPSAEAVRTALDAQGSAPPERRAKVEVRESSAGFSLQFAWYDREQTDTRTLTAARDCQARAQTAAVVLATWLGVLPVHAQPGAPAIAAPLEPAPPIAAASAASAVVEPRTWWLGVGLGATAGGGIVPGARVELARSRPSGKGFGWVVSLQGALPRSHAIGGGTSRWIRPALAVGGTASWRVGRIAIAADLGPVASVTIAWGSDYPSNQTDRAPVLGASAGLRVLLGPGPSRPWIELRAVDWFGTQRLRFDSALGAPVTAELPALEGSMTLGWSLPL